MARSSSGGCSAAVRDDGSTAVGEFVRLAPAPAGRCGQRSSAHHRRRAYRQAQGRRAMIGTT
eukprot:scaffold123156_cov32-Tisochrysis_lutea.AAC.1